MAIFEDISVEWKGKTYVIPANRMLGAIAAMEQHISLIQLMDISRLSLASLARAYASVLRYAGGRAEDDEVYADLFASGTRVTEQMIPVINTLVLILMPAGALAEETAAIAAAPAAPGNRPAARRSSRTSTRRRSVSAAG